MTSYSMVNNRRRKSLLDCFSCFRSGVPEYYDIPHYKIQKQQFNSSPIAVASPLHSYPSCQQHNQYARQTRTNRRHDAIKIVCISDTHNGHDIREFHERIRRLQGDILIHAGDFSNEGKPEEVMSAFHWLCSLDNFTYKVFIAGNMDGIGLDKPSFLDGKNKHELLNSKAKNVFYLENESKDILGINIYGCPYTPKFYGGFQYQLRSQQAQALWNNIPYNCDILVSHGPPAHILDQSSRGTKLKKTYNRFLMIKQNLWLLTKDIINEY
ncbi:unnamed protein product [Rotaria socialis]|uniref:Calcineurin-like phosphoesterase domain-containing protein n=1 Tax=Rotaria socialis TaxID=392032 RepID=A0A821G965_9BILA|nr:unnamed protein product [Rotaria socialis]CAF4663352.1 unnamed protein product [Rotaria socialis]